MSELVSVEKLRAYGSRVRIDHDGDYLDLWKACDEIQAEVDSRYFELPVDADGVPIHLGDRLDNFGEQFTCEWIEYEAGSASVGYATRYGELPPAFAPDECEHVKTRTVEDVLRAFYHDASDADAFCTVRLDDVLAKYAAELRGMMEADDD